MDLIILLVCSFGGVLFGWLLSERSRITQNKRSATERKNDIRDADIKRVEDIEREKNTRLEDIDRLTKEKNNEIRRIELQREDDLKIEKKIREDEFKKIMYFRDVERIESRIIAYKAFENELEHNKVVVADFIKEARGEKKDFNLSFIMDAFRLYQGVLYLDGDEDLLRNTTFLYSMLEKQSYGHVETIDNLIGLKDMLSDISLKFGELVEVQMNSLETSHNTMISDIPFFR